MMNMDTPETHWINVTKDQFEEILNRLEWAKDSFFVSFDSPYKADVEIYSAEPMLYDDFFHLNGAGLNNIHPVCAKLYCVEEDIAVLFEKFNLSFPETVFSYYGIYEEYTRSALFFNAKGYGLIKSAAIGLYSSYLREGEYIPMHGALLQIKNKGLVIFGGYQTGKTSMVAKLLLSNPETKIGTDDWMVLRKDEHHLYGTALEKNLSTRDEGRFTRLTDQPYKTLTGNKHYIPVPSFNSFPSKIEIHYIICLNSKWEQKGFYALTPEELVYCIGQTNYHSPSGNKNKINNEQIILSTAGQIPCYMLNPFLWHIDDHQIAHDIINYLV